MLRAMPNYVCIPPGGCNGDVQAAWYFAATAKDAPTALVLTPVRTCLSWMAAGQGALKGGYM